MNQWGACKMTKEEEKAIKEDHKYFIDDNYADEVSYFVYWLIIMFLLFVVVIGYTLL